MKKTIPALFICSFLFYAQAKTSALSPPASTCPIPRQPCSSFSIQKQKQSQFISISEPFSYNFDFSNNSYVIQFSLNNNFSGSFGLESGFDKDNKIDLEFSNGQSLYLFQVGNGVYQVKADQNLKSINSISGTFSITTIHN